MQEESEAREQGHYDISWENLTWLVVHDQPISTTEVMSSINYLGAEQRTMLAQSLGISHARSERASWTSGHNIRQEAHRLCHTALIPVKTLGRVPCSVTCWSSMVTPAGWVTAVLSECWWPVIKIAVYRVSIRRYHSPKSLAMTKHRKGQILF